MLNKEQIISSLKAMLTLVIGWAIGKGYMSEDTGLMITGVVMAAAPIAWSLYTNTYKANIAKAAEIPAVEAIVTDAKTANASPSNKVISEATAAIRNF